MNEKTLNTTAQVHPPHHFRPAAYTSMEAYKWHLIIPQTNHSDCLASKTERSLWGTYFDSLSQITAALSAAAVINAANDKPLASLE